MGAVLLRNVGDDREKARDTKSPRRREASLAGTGKISAQRPGDCIDTAEKADRDGRAVCAE